jgi:hypothetical protein
MVAGLKTMLPGLPPSLPPLETGEALRLGEALTLGEALRLGEALERGEPLELSEPLEPGEPLEPLFMVKTATPTMAAMITPPTSSMLGLTVVLAGAAWAIAGGTAQPGGTAAT